MTYTKAGQQRQRPLKAATHDEYAYWLSAAKRAEESGLVNLAQAYRLYAADVAEQLGITTQ